MTAPRDPLELRLFDLLTAWAERTPDADASITGDERLSYGDLDAAVRRCARGLLACGVGPGDRVATLTTPGGAFLVIFLATASIGAIWSGLNPRHTPAELDATVARLEPKVVFCRKTIEVRDYGPWLQGLTTISHRFILGDACASAVVTPQLAPDADLQVARAVVDPRAPCLIVFTSGSTGEPKGVMISHAALVGCSRVQVAQWRAGPLRVLNNLPINHIGAVGDLACYALAGGGASVFCERFDPENSLRLIRAERVSVFAQVPTQFELTLASPGFSADALESVQLIVWGGAHASESLVQRLAALGKRVATSYGQTETVGSVTFTRPETPLERLSTTVGVAAAPHLVRVADETSEVQVKSPLSMNGYWRAPEAAADVFTADGWLRTGDTGVLNAEGELTLTGRTSDTFKSGGYNIYPAEIETALLACAGVGQAAVVSWPDAIFGSVGFAAIVPAAGVALDAEEVRNELKTRLANYKVPKHIDVLDDLPRLPVGKIDKAALRRRLLAAREA